MIITYAKMNHENYSKMGYVSMISGVPSYLVSDTIVKETRNWIKYVVYYSKITNPFYLG